MWAASHFGSSLCTPVHSGRGESPHCAVIDDRESSPRKPGQAGDARPSGPSFSILHPRPFIVADVGQALPDGLTFDAAPQVILTAHSCSLLRQVHQPDRSRRRHGRARISYLNCVPALLSGWKARRTFNDDHPKVIPHAAHPLVAKSAKPTPSFRPL